MRLHRSTSISRLQAIDFRVRFLQLSAQVIFFVALQPYRAPQLGDISLRIGVSLSRYHKTNVDGNSTPFTHDFDHAYLLTQVSDLLDQLGQCAMCGTRFDLNTAICGSRVDRPLAQGRPSESRCPWG